MLRQYCSRHLLKAKSSCQLSFKARGLSSLDTRIYVLFTIYQKYAILNHAERHKNHNLFRTAGLPQAERAQGRLISTCLSLATRKNVKKLNGWSNYATYVPYVRMKYLP